jgi:hypothetical protein
MEKSSDSPRLSFLMTDAGSKPDAGKKSGKLRVRWPFAVLLVGVSVWFAMADDARETEILAITTCPFRGEPATVVSPGLSHPELVHVSAHEGVHIQQCRELGPIKYRIRNLTSKLSLEAPAYCAGATARIALGMPRLEARMRLIDDAVEALRRTADSAEVVTALEEVCPAVLMGRPPARAKISA